jgi:hypothetical protein
MTTLFVSLFELDGDHPEVAVFDTIHKAKAALHRAWKNTPHPDRVVEACIFECGNNEHSTLIPIGPLLSLGQRI